MNRCLCGCGAEVRGVVRPGHDLRVAARLMPGVSATQAAAALVREYGSIAEAARVLGLVTRPS